ncbi:DUF4124 domain-containing protein [Massilia sp. PWRC2]|uniref:DUF4124 domain-containing protein n=1 Tax=Massilia sp. PWRC2 TaxID=2804626 RepID=UPI003CF885E8
MRATLPARLSTLLSTLPSTLTAGLCAAVLALPAWASGDIVKCVDGAGHVTLTDSDCGSASATVLVAAARPAPVVRRVAPLVPGGAPLEHAAWVSSRPRSSTLAGDAATLRAARSSLQALDEAASSARRQRLAALN